MMTAEQFLNEIAEGFRQQAAMLKRDGDVIRAGDTLWILHGTDGQPFRSRIEPCTCGGAVCAGWSLIWEPAPWATA